MMKNIEKRLKRLESQASAKHVFVEWKGGRGWSEEEKAEEIRRHPEGGVFWRSLLEAFELKPESESEDKS